MDFTAMMTKMGIFSYVYPLETVIDGRPEIQIGETISTDLGWVYGISTEIDGTSPTDQSVVLPNFAQASGLFLNLKYGQTFFQTNYRMSNLIFVAPGTGIAIGDKRYLDVSVPLSMDLKKSTIRNPQGLTGFSTLINFHYISRLTYEFLVGEKLLVQYEQGTIGSK